MQKSLKQVVGDRNVQIKAKLFSVSSLVKTNCLSNCYSVGYEMDVKQHRLLISLSSKKIEQIQKEIDVRMMMMMLNYDKN